MRLVSFGEDGYRVGVISGDGSVVEVTGLLSSAAPGVPGGMRQLIENYEDLYPRLEAAQKRGNGISLTSLVLSPPVVDPTKIVAAPVNYIDHMEEMDQGGHIDSLGVFLKAPSSLTGHGSRVFLPYSNRRFDQEGELCFVIGKRARHVRVDQAHDYIFGYSVLLDITMRGGEDRSTRKSFDTFTPIGPWITTPDEVGELADLELRCWVNGTLRQKASISDLIWGVPELLVYVSSVMTLHPGDVISTGTPKGVGPIAGGDEIIAEISKIGRLGVTVSASGAVLSATRGGGIAPGTGSG